MYEAHFGLSRRPFEETVDLGAYVPLASRETVARRLRFGLEQGRGAALLYGPPGSGKTLLARCLARDLSVEPRHLTFPAMPAAELLALVARELTGDRGEGPVPPVGTSLAKMRKTLSAATMAGKRMLLIVDEAHLIDDPATFEALRALLNFATLGPPDLWLLLVGCAELLLNLPASLADRLAARCLLPALSRSETAAYARGRLAAAGATEPLFDDAAVAALHHAGDGLPRRVSRLADMALLIAYAEGRPRPDTRHVRIAAREFEPDDLAA